MTSFALNCHAYSYIEDHIYDTLEDSDIDNFIVDESSSNPLNTNALKDLAAQLWNNPKCWKKENKAGYKTVYWLHGICSER